MDKVTLINEMNTKVNDLLDAHKVVNAHLQEMEDVKGEGAESVHQMESTIEAKEEALTVFTELGEVKLAKQEIDLLKEDLQLVHQLTANKLKAMKVELEDKIVEAFTKHKQAIFFYKGVVDIHFINNTTLATLEDDAETLKNIAYTLERVFAQLRQILLDEKIVAIQDQNKSYKNIHLGQVTPYTELLEFKRAVSRYVQDLKRAGILNRN